MFYWNILYLKAGGFVSSTFYQQTSFELNSNFTATIFQDIPFCETSIYYTASKSIVFITGFEINLNWQELEVICYDFKLKIHIRTWNFQMCLNLYLWHGHESERPLIFMKYWEAPTKYSSALKLDRSLWLLIHEFLNTKIFLFWHGRKYFSRSHRRSILQYNCKWKLITGDI